MTGQRYSLLIAAVAIEALMAGYNFAARQFRTADLIVIAVLAAAPYLVAVYSILKFERSPDRGPHRSIIAAALLFRLTVIAVDPPLTNDLYRYRWEGMVQAHGGNPYVARPSDPAWAELRDENYARIPTPDAPGGYGPLFSLLEVAVYRVAPPTQTIWFKLPGIAGDLATIAALAWLLRRRGLPASRVLIWAWCPLPVLEFWANGHNDSLAVAFVVAACAAARPLVSYGWLALAIAAKLWPVLLVPAFLVDRRSWKSAAAVPLVFAACAAPYVARVDDTVRYMSGYLGGWRNNDSLFGVILWLTRDS